MVGAFLYNFFNAALKNRMANALFIDKQE